MDGDTIGKLQGMEKEKRNAILRTIKASYGCNTSSNSPSYGT